MTDDSYKSLQAAIMLHPETGDLIPEGGGIRKVRWANNHQGKRGGIRVIYYFKAHMNQIYFLFAYPKTSQDNLTEEQKRILGKLVKEEFK